MKKFLVGFVLFAMMFSIVPGALAVTESPECEYDLIAGQHTDVGTITVQRIGNLLNFNYETDEGWCIREIHLTALTEAPEACKTNAWYIEKYITKSGNPKVGQFEINEELCTCVTEYSGTLDLTNISTCPFETLYVAAHAVVCKCECEPISTGCGYENTSEGEGWAINYSNYTIGDPTYGGIERYDPLLCLGEADTFTNPSNTFTCMGQGGSIELYFNGSICGDGDNSTPDLEIYEVTYSHSAAYVESISIEAFYNGSYYPVGNVTNRDGDGTYNPNIFVNYIYDLPSGVCIEKIRITEISTRSPNDYDLDAVKANYWCVPEDYEYICNCTGCCQTAWGNGTSFPGNNWATYFEYPCGICD